jgi:DNA mismatch repair protein MutS2
MLYPKNLTTLLGFEKIREAIIKKCISEEGRILVEKLKFSKNPKAIQLWLNETDEMKKIIDLGYSFPLYTFYQIQETLDKARIIGGFVEMDELFALKNFLEIYDKCSSFITKFIDFDIPHLNNLLPEQQVNPSLFRNLDNVFEPNGDLKSNASPELRKIRQEQLAKESSLRKKMGSLHEQFSSQGYISDDLAPTIRNGRACVAVKAEYKRVVKGMIHDESSTGQTTYIEPEQVVMINNELTELHYRERREIMRILTELTDSVRQNSHELKLGGSFLAYLDLIRSKALFAQDLKAIKPTINQQDKIEIKQAKHPLLLLNPTEHHKVVANDLIFDLDTRLLLISGPNAGGKSVTLKTFGLLQYMLQSGLLVPVAEESSFKTFDQLFADIGDQQSLEDDLSTYSAHLTNMKHFLTHANNKTLVLIDEFGTGTEPEYGGAIAETILENIVETGAYGLITTHYANLKVYAQNTNGIQNGAMMYDIRSLTPLYQMVLGEPGRSYALEIAQSIGLQSHIIEKAQDKIGGSHVSFDALVKEVEIERLKLEELTTSLTLKEASLIKKLAKIDVDQQHLKDNRKTIIEEAKEAGRNIIQGSNRLIEKTVRDIKENKASKESIKNAHQKVDHQKKLLTPKKKKEPVSNIILKKGDFVRMIGMSSVAEILKIDGNNAEISSGILKMRVKLTQLEKVGEKPKSGKGSNISQQLINKRSTFKAYLDVRGKRTEEAIDLVTKFVDEGLILGESELQILHGKGNGILRTMIRQHLKGMRGIATMVDAHIEHGGAGITVVTLE